MLIKWLRFLLFPFSLLYGLGVIARNKAYDWGWLSATTFKMPLIVVGNLAVGGAGKSPMTEYLVRLFKNDYKLAVLSRGYGRKTKGFRLVAQNDLAALSGDEPLQFKQHFPDQTIAVCEDRVAGVERLQANHDLLILDDAFQHRALKPGFSILLFEYSWLHKSDFLLPAGNLREPIWAKDRADVLVITKSPKHLTHSEKLKVRQQLQPHLHQALFFSYLQYRALKVLNSSETRELDTLNNNTQILLLTGIANPKPILEELHCYTQSVEHHQYPDHYPFSTKNILKLAEAYHQMPGPDKLIITTEKDAQRLNRPEFASLLSGLPLYILPVEAAFEAQEQQDFEHLLKQHVREHQKHH